MRQGTKRTRGVRRAVTAVMAIGLLGVVSCVPDPVVVDTFHLDVDLGDHRADISWDAATAPGVAAYEVQWRLGNQLVWTSLPIVTTTSTTASGFTGPRAYRFRVRAVAADHTPIGEWSPEADFLYVEPALPIVRIDTNELPVLDKETYVPATMDIVPNGSGVAAYHGTLGIRGRGNSTWTYPKKPYRLKLDTKSAIMGMPSDKDWVLLANFLDKSQLRNWTASRMSEAVGMPWTPRFRHVEVIVNGTYEGVYQLGEHVKLDNDRVDVDEMEPTDNSGEALTGGYLFEIDMRLEQNNEPGFRTRFGVPVVVKNPDPATTEQFAYAHDTIVSFEDALYAPTFTDPTTGYRPQIDLDSWVDAYLVQELLRQRDAFVASTYFSKPRGGKLTAGPLWDFDLSMGSTAEYSIPGPATGWHVNNTQGWPTRLMDDPAFESAVSARLTQLRPAFEQIATSISTYGATLDPAIANDEARWLYVSGAADQPAFLTTWLQQRLAWMDATI